MPNFLYRPLLWFFCSKAADNFINRTTKRAMRVIYNDDNEEVLDTHSQKDGALIIHKRNLQKLMVETWDNQRLKSPIYVGFLHQERVGI